MRLKLLALSKKKLLVLVFICFYIAGICLSIFRIHEINKILVLLRNYLDSLPADKLADISIDTLVQQSPSYQKNLLEVLANYPTILKYDSSYIEIMGYGQPHRQNYRSAIEHYNNLLMERNYLKQDLRDSFNPLTAIKKLFSFPSTLIEWIGFSPKETTSKIFNILSWVVTFILGLYNDEIKALIALLFQRLLHT